MLLSLLLHLGSATWLSTSNEIVFSLRFFGGSFEGWGGGGWADEGNQSQRERKRQKQDSRKRKINS